MTEMNEIEKLGRGRPRKYVFPAQLACSVTGKIVKTNPTQFQAMLNASGKDMATFMKTYVCRAGRKQVKIEAKAKRSGADANVAPTSTEPVGEADAETI
jgi:hypothetical protein